MEGQRIVFNIGFILSLVAFLSLAVSYTTPYWVQSWPRIHSGFKKIGLWEACFAGLVVPRDPSQKAYHGCWWILAKEYWQVRRYIMPAWFVATQVLLTLCFAGELLTMIFLLIIWGVTGNVRKDGMGKKSPPWGMLTFCVIFTIISAIVKAFCVVMFGLYVEYDYAWMPRHEINFLSWSYGLACVSTFMSIFSSMAQVSYWRIRRKDFYRPDLRQATTPMIS